MEHGQLRRGLLMLATCAAQALQGQAYSQWSCGDILYPFPFAKDIAVLAGIDADISGDGVPESLVCSQGGVCVARDWDGDGILDLLTTSLPIASVSGSSDIVAADMDGDGDLDIATLGSGSSPNVSVAYYRNVGGVLVGAAVYVASDSNERINAADVSGDGRADLVLGSRSPALIQIFRGTAQVPLQPVNVSAPDPVYATEVGDFDGDGDNDIVALCRPSSGGSGSVILYRNMGGLSFQLQTIASGDFGGEMRSGDIDGDGDPDLCLSIVSGGWKVAVLRAAGGSFLPLQSYPVTEPISSLQMADMDGDGRHDVVYGGGVPGRGTLEVRRGGADGTLSAADAYGVQLNPDRLALLDTDRDGAREAVVWDSSITSTSGHTVLKGRPGGRLVGFQVISVANNVADFQPVDMDGDLDDDLVVGIYGSQQGVRLYRSQGDGTYAMEQFVALSGVTSQATIACADLDNDGDMDVAAAWFNAGRIDILQNIGGVLQAMPPVVSSGINAPLRAADVNGDGWVDLVSDAAAAPFVRVHLNAGNLSFADAPLQPSVTAASKDIRVGDVNGDGFIDLVTHGTGISWHPGDGSGVFGTAQLVHPTALGNNLRMNDIDQDGDLDLICRQDFPEWALDDRIGILQNDGVGQFEFVAPFPISDIVNDFEVADLDGNGIRDLMLLSNNAPGVQVTLDFGSATFGKGTTYHMASSNSDVRLGDADADGWLDVFARPSNGQFLVVARSQLCQRPIVPADLNGDGVVGGADLGLLLVKWGATGAGEPADLDGDLIVDGADLGILLVSWTP